MGSGLVLSYCLKKNTTKISTMKKIIPFMLSVLAIASIASITVLGNTQTAYAGSFCTLSPTQVTLTLAKDESSAVITKIVDCDNTISLITQDPFDKINNFSLVYFR